AFLASIGTEAYGEGVPTCPGWTVGDLLAHVGGTHSNVAEVIDGCRRTGSPEPPTFAPAEAPAEPAELRRWCAESGRRLLALLEEAPPDLPVWNWSRAPQVAT